VALSLVLVAGAILFARSLNKLQTVDTGFEQEGLLITRANFSRLNLPVDRRQVFKQDVLERLKAIPGVAAAAETRVVPLSGGGWGEVVSRAGRPGPTRPRAGFSDP